MKIIRKKIKNNIKKSNLDKINNKNEKANISKSIIKNNNKNSKKNDDFISKDFNFGDSLEKLETKNNSIFHHFNDYENKIPILIQNIDNYKIYNEDRMINILELRKRNINLILYKKRAGKNTKYI